MFDIITFNIELKGMRKRIMCTRTKKKLSSWNLKLFRNHCHVNKMDKSPSIDLLLEEDDDEEMEQLFLEAFKSMELCHRRLDKMRPGASISTPTPAAEIMHGDLCPRQRGAVRKGSLWVGSTRSSPILYTYVNKGSLNTRGCKHSLVKHIQHI